ncbi:MAG: argininosuccinate lyase [Tissierellia bacterium]|nr:argininosuccinate lyase [Tissierellia bacterium]
MKLWENKYKGNLDDFADLLNKSIEIDQRLVFYDIKGSLSHSKMLCEKKIIEKDDYEKIKQGLLEIKDDLENEKLKIDTSYEDIHSFIEGELTKRIGNSAKKLHTARSRNDQVTLDLKMYCRDICDDLVNLLEELIKTLVDKAKKHKESYMPGYTHLQIAQPVTFAHYILAYAQMFIRDIKRIKMSKELLDESPLGAGALSATTYDIDRFMTAKDLGFSKPTENSMDSVSDRDYVLDLLYDISMIMMHLSRFCEEIIIFSSKEFNYITLSDEFSTGSSIMPQKKNPDMAELIRAKSANAFSNLNNLLVVMKALTLSYNKDMQEDKEILFRSIDNVFLSLKVFNKMIDTLKVNVKRLKENALNGYINATDLADYLTKKGMTFRDSYRLVSEIVHDLVLKNKSINELSLEEFKNYSQLIEEDIYEVLELKNLVNNRKVYGSANPQMVEIQIENILKELS